MSKFWYVALYEYKRHVLRKRFIWALLSVPLVLLIGGGTGALVERMEDNRDPVGYVDLGGALAEPLPVPEGAGSSDPVEIIAFSDETAARQALDAGDIQGYYLLSPEYPQSRQADLVYYQPPGDNAKVHFRAFLRVNLVTDLSPESAQLLLEDVDVVIQTPDGGREFSARNAINLILPALSGFVFMYLLTTTGGYLSGAVVEEKENRTMEILATSMSTNQFILGKIVGIIGIAFTQLIFWLAFFAAAILAGANALELDWLQISEIDVPALLPLLLVLVPAYFLYAALYLTVSSTVTESTESQQMSGIFAMPLAFSYWFGVVIVSNPNGPLSVLLSLFPLTAPTLMSLRMAFTVVPMEQVLASAGILTASAALAIWLAARAFDLGMLRYGQRLRFKEILRPNRGPR